MNRNLIAEDLLESILSKDACKVGLPTLERLVQHPFWQEYVPKFHEQYMSGSDASKFSLKLTNAAKEHIKVAAQKTEQRLREEQKSVRVLNFLLLPTIAIDFIKKNLMHFR